MFALPIGFFQPAAVVATGLLLDSIACVGVYSFRLLRTAYTGPCMRVRRSSDNVEADIGFSAGAIDQTALLAHTGSVSGYVSKWYDQSGNGNDATQTVYASQFTIVASGSLITRSGRPAIQSVGGLGILSVATTAVAGLSSSTAICAFTNEDGNSGWFDVGPTSSLTHTPYSDGSAYENYLAASRVTFSGYGLAASATTPIIHTVQNTGTTMSVLKYGTQIGATQAITFSNSPAIMQNNSLSRFNGITMQEMIFTSSVLSTAKRLIVERSLGGYLGITVA